MAKVVSIHSYRGGTGKSNLTANLAYLLAGAGSRVAVIDTDIQSPGIHILFGLDEESVKHSLDDFLWRSCPIEAAAHDVGPQLKLDNGEAAVPAGALYLVPSSIKASDIARILREGYDVSLLNDGFHDLIDRLNLDYLLIDTHPGLNEETLLSIAISDVLVLILRPDRQDFQGTAVTVDVARKLDVMRMLLVVNKALPGYDFEALARQVEEIYQTPVAGVLPLSEDVVRLASGDIFSLRFPDHVWSGTVRAIAETITG